MSKPYTLKDTIHQSTGISVALEKIGSNFYFSMVPVRPSTPTIVNEAIADDNWHAIATGLTDVLEWRLSERAGQDFYFAFENNPTNYCTSFGWIGGQTSPGQIYVKRKNTTTNNIELLIWQI